MSRGTRESAHLPWCVPGPAIEPVASVLKSGWRRALLVRGAEAQSGPGAVDRHLADGLHAMGGQGCGEPVAVQVRPELAALGVADPGQAVRSRRRYRLF